MLFNVNWAVLSLFTFRGFCYFNSVAIAAKLLQQRLNVSKVLIVDWVSFLCNSMISLQIRLLMQ